MSLTHEIHVLAWHGTRRAVSRLTERFDGLDVTALQGPEQSPQRVAHTTNPLLAGALKDALEKAGAEIVVIEKEPAAAWRTFWRRTVAADELPELSLASAPSSDQDDGPSHDADENDESEDVEPASAASPSARRRFEALEFMVLGTILVGLLLAGIWFGMSLLPDAATPDPNPPATLTSHDDPADDTETSTSNITGSPAAPRRPDQVIEQWPLEAPGLPALEARDSASLLTRWILVVVGSMVIIIASFVLLRGSPVWMRLAQTSLCGLLVLVSGLDAWIAQTAASAQRGSYALEFSEVQRERYAALQQRLVEPEPPPPNSGEEGSGSATPPNLSPPPNARSDSDPNGSTTNGERAADGSGTDDRASESSGARDGSSNAPTDDTNRASASSERPTEPDGSGAPDAAGDHADPGEEPGSEGSTDRFDPESALESGMDEDGSGDEPALEPDGEGSAERRSVVDMVRGLQAAPPRPCEFSDEQRFERLHCLLQTRERLRPSDAAIAATEECAVRVGAALPTARRHMREVAEVNAAQRVDRAIAEISVALPLPSEPPPPTPVSRPLLACGILGGLSTLLAAVLARRALARLPAGGQR